MKKNIQVYKLAIKELPDFFVELFQTSLGLSELHAKGIVSSHLVPYLTHLKDTLYTVVELPYVDKMYRDSFYHYYSSKLHLNERETIRVSFFSEDIKSISFTKVEEKQFLQSKYLGFLVIRPTFPKIIGRSAISPRALMHSNFVSCKATIHSTVYSLKVSVESFPHSSQDNQAITCAETTIWSLLEYFGNKYPEYKPILPSQINKILQKFSYKRQLPSEGLTAEQVTYAVRELGFGAMIYSKSKHEDFHAIISVFVESGIPVIAVIKNNSVAHAVNIIGHEVDSFESLLANKQVEEIGNGVKVIDYHKFERRFIIIDDNRPPYQMATLKAPVEYYGTLDSRWQDCSITNIIVPLYSKIYLDAIRARKNFKIILRNSKLGFTDTEERVVKVFLASSRSYKEYIALNEGLDIKIKRLILSVAMPKFIWVAEISSVENFRKDKIEGILIQDATEAIETNEETFLMVMPVFCGFLNGKFYRFLDQKLKILRTFAVSFEKYKRNLN